MANVQSGNCWYVDSAHTTVADDLVANVVVVGIFVTPTAANGRIVLADASTGTVMFDLRAPNAGQTVYFDLSANPAAFANGIQVATLVNAVATLIGDVRY
jgi:hypothetical protein